ncbi:MAG: sigma-70 family RNA polymerase sigma factor [Pirellulales bacterium]
MSDRPEKADREPISRFMTTRWDDVLASRGRTAEARKSLSELCARYYAPVHAFIRSYSGNEQDALDWTHSFFAKLLEGRSLDTVRPEQSRFRSYLLGAVKHFIADERSKGASVKRGGAALHLSFSDKTVEVASSPADSSTVNDAYFDRQWALAILDQSLQELKERVSSTEFGKHFELLKDCLIGDSDALDRNNLAASIGLTKETVNQVLHRWRKQFREIVKSAVASTVSRPGEVDGEMLYLIQCLTVVRVDDSIDP